MDAISWLLSVISPFPTNIKGKYSLSVLKCICSQEWSHSHYTALKGAQVFFKRMFDRKLIRLLSKLYCLIFWTYLNYCLWTSSAQLPKLTLRTRRYAAHAPGRCCNNEETFNGGAQYCVNLMVMGLLKSRVVNCLLRIHSNTLRRFLSVPHNEFVRHFSSINPGNKLTFAEWWAFRSHDNRKCLDRWMAINWPGKTLNYKEKVRVCVHECKGVITRKIKVWL
jgi:hypothetical protein